MHNRYKDRSIIDIKIDIIIERKVDINRQIYHAQIDRYIKDRKQIIYNLELDNRQVY